MQEHTGTMLNVSKFRFEGCRTRLACGFYLPLCNCSVEVRNPTGSRHSSCRVTVDPPPENALALIKAAGGAGDVVST